MPLDVARLRDSDLVGMASGEEFRAAVLLWCAAWHQIPAGSLPDNNRVLARLAGFGNNVESWMKCRAMALKNFLICNDNRLYHPVICDKVLEALSRQQQASSAAKARWGKEKPSHTGALPPHSVSNAEAMPRQGHRQRDRQGQSKEVSEPIGSLSSSDDAPKNSTRENAEQMMAMWNELASRYPCLPAVRKLTTLRIKQAALRLSEIGGLEVWQEALEKIEISGHCLGNNDRGWVANFDFLLQPSSLTKLLEGNYDDRRVITHDPLTLAALEERAGRED